MLLVVIIFSCVMHELLQQQNLDEFQIYFFRLCRTLSHFKECVTIFISTGICYHVPFLASMLLIFCGKKHWVPFLPTVPICLVLMAVAIAVLPSLVAAGLELSIFAIYGVMILGGLCAGLSQSLVSRMVVLFPGGKSSLLVRNGESKLYIDETKNISVNLVQILYPLLIILLGISRVLLVNVCIFDLLMGV